MKLIALALVLAIPFCGFCQYDNYGGRHREETSTLSVFSENGERFFLVLNNVSQNNTPVSKIRVEGLPQFGNDVQILFADNTTPAIRKRVNIADPVDGKAVNMTLKIVRERDGYPRLKFQRCSEVEHGYKPPRDEYVMNYGNPQQVNSVTETTYTDPNTGQLVTETTTTTTTNNYTPPPAAPRAMDIAAFNDAKQSISNASFDDTKLSTAKTILGNNYVSTAQVMEICNLFSFENTKLAFAKFAYGRTVDQNNYFKVGDVFGFDNSRNELNNYISGKH